MDLAASAFPLWVIGLGWMASLPVAALSPVLAPWRCLRDDVPTHVWCGGVLALVLLWNVPIGGTASAHLVGMTAYTLLVGPAMALSGAALAVALGATVHGTPWLDAGVTYAIVAVVPVALTGVVQQVAARLRIFHPMVRVVLVGWTAGALSTALVGVLLHGFRHASAPVHFASPSDALVIVIVGLACAEALLTGLAIALFVIHAPGAVHALVRRGRSPAGR